VELLGGFRVSVGSRAVGEDGWRLRKARGLVALLALEPGHRMHRERLMDLLWPDLDAGAAANNLRYALHVARRTLDPDPAAASCHLRLEGELLALCPGGMLWVDVEAFEEAAANARRLGEPAVYRAAIELYAGELLPRDRYEEWAEERREGLRRDHLALLVGLAWLHEGCGELEPAIEALRRVVAEERTHEVAHAGLMRLYAIAGRRDEALKQYERLREVLSQALDTAPDAESRLLHGGILAGKLPTALPSQAEERRERPGFQHNLPTPRTSFVGREHELVEVGRLLTMSRLLTLTGAGGSGKTRLALEVARGLVGAYPDGVWLVELAGLSEGALVAQAVAGRLGVREQPSRPLAGTLVDVLRERSLLLVVDNCEHLVDEAARLVETLLDGCPRLRVLATSREVLGIAGELTWRVPSLSLPEPRRPPAAGELHAYGSSRLFVERARSRRPGFMLTPENVRAVAEICTRLDGIPLAIELAAARMGVLSAPQIAERLGDSLGLLTEGGRTAPPWHRTLTGALDWSHELLSEPERALFRRLSVFAGGVDPGGGRGGRREARSGEQRNGRGRAGIDVAPRGSFAGGGVGAGRTGTVSVVGAAPAVRVAEAGGVGRGRGRAAAPRGLLPRPGGKGEAGDQRFEARGVADVPGDGARQPANGAALGRGDGGRSDGYAVGERGLLVLVAPWVLGGGPRLARGGIEADFGVGVTRGAGGGALGRGDDSLGAGRP